VPRVPEYNGFQATPNTLPQTRLTAPNMPDVAGQQTQDMARGLMSAGGQVGQVALDLQREANKLKEDDALNQAVKARTDMQVEALQLRGRDALERPDGKSLPDEYSEKLQKQFEAIEQGLGNDAQKQAFRQQTAQIKNQFYGSLSGHMVEQKNVLRNETWEATITTASSQAGMLWGDKAMVEQSAGAIRATVDEMAAANGWDDKIKQAKVAAAMSPMHAAVVQGMVDGDRVDLARAYYEANAETMSMGVRERAMKLIEAGDFERKTQDAADTLWAQTGGNALEALKTVREKYSGKEEDAIVTRIKTLDAEKTTLRERAQRDASDAAWSLYADGKRIPASVWASMDGRDKVAIRRTMRAEAEARAAGTTIKTDPNVYYALSIAAATDPNFKGEDLRRYGDKLSPGDFRHFVDLQAKTQKPEEQGAIVTINTQKTQTARAAGLKTEQAAQFYIEADKALGPDAKSLSYEQRQAVLDRLVLPGEVKGGLYDPNMRLYEAQQSGRADTFTPEFSDADRRKAKSALQKQGIATPSSKQIDETMRRAYGFK
jgi:hypothetical protein